MLSRHALNDELNSKGDAFHEFIQEHSASLGAYLDVLDRVAKTPVGETERMVEGVESVGAMPSDEIERRSVSICFDNQWRNHEQARHWAAEILTGRTTFAADGSQIYAGKETSLPIAAVQIGWFENPHDAAATYGKNSRFEILTPGELLADQEEPMNPDIRVEAKRYHGEIERIAKFLESKAGWEQRGLRMPVAFFDNPLLVPFSQKGLQKSFLDATKELVELSRKTRVPVVGYVDRSFSRDILTLLDSFGSGKRARETSLFDASILRARHKDGRRVVDSWGDRTCFFYSRRRGLDAFIDESTGRSSIGFVYLQTTGESAPARIDLPSWVAEEGLTDEVIDVVRAECVIGLGYPYALESADQTAVISPTDRDVFFRALQEFATREKLDFSVARKDASKARRR